MFASKLPPMMLRKEVILLIRSLLAAALLCAAPLHAFGDTPKTGEQSLDYANAIDTVKSTGAARR